MGDRVSISFKQKQERWGGPSDKTEVTDESPALFHHWGGTELPKVAFEWFKKVKAETKAMGQRSDPFTRLEPRNLMVQLIGTLAREKWDQYTTGLTKDKKGITKHDTWMTYSMYLGKDGTDGDNSDNGHYTIDVDDCKMYNDKGESIA
ncbi:MAG: hypothetical protein MK217_06350 [Gammaproteobacteria bacterium]|nr:hypothetical protein [Gammaproteobacteria bacterium]